MFSKPAALLVTACAALAFAAPAPDAAGAVFDKRIRLPPAPALLRYCIDNDFAPPCAYSDIPVSVTINTCVDVPAEYRNAISSIELSPLAYNLVACVLYVGLQCTGRAYELLTEQAKLADVGFNDMVNSYRCSNNL